MNLSSPFVIAEAGVNHNGRRDLALALVDLAAESGADAVKFQTFRAELLATKGAPKARYQAERADSRDETQFDMLRRLELDEETHHAIAEHCRARGIEFMSTPFDAESVPLLLRCGVRRLKVPSGEIVNPILLRAIAETSLPIVLSTGMSTLGEIEGALTLIASVATGDPRAVWTEEGQKTLAGRVTLLHCTTEYPAPPSSANLLAMKTIASAFGLPVGYSDHTNGVAVSCAAVALGATVIEKHFTLDRSLPGPDHAASLEGAELTTFVRALRDVAAAMGHGRKVPMPEEVPNRGIARRSVVASARIRAGELLSRENTTLKRPGTGISAARYEELLGRPARRDYEPDELID